VRSATSGIDRRAPCDCAASRGPGRRGCARIYLQQTPRAWFANRSCLRHGDRESNEPYRNHGTRTRDSGSVGAGEALSIIRTGDTVIVDGLRGEITISPSEHAIEEALGEVNGIRLLHEAAQRTKPAVRDSRRRAISLMANVELPAEAIFALDHGAEGIGLYRTEFIYIDRATIAVGR